MVQRTSQRIPRVTGTGPAAPMPTQAPRANTPGGSPLLDLVGMKLGPENRYEVTKLLGEGGMGRVYLATDSMLDREVAVKVLSDRVAGDEEASRRFMREARVAASVAHQNVVGILDLGTINNGGTFTPFFVMERLCGSDLGDVLNAYSQAQEFMPWERASPILVQTCDALGAAHSRGITHRDLKPENIFITEQGGSDWVKLLDFGIAKLVNDHKGHNTVQTQAGMVVGTAGYMSPEQLRGEHIDGRSDIFALGLVMYKIGCGRLPFEPEEAGNNPVTLIMRYILDPFPLPSTFRPDISADAQQIILKALEKDREARFQTTAEFAAAVRKCGMVPEIRIVEPQARDGVAPQIREPPPMPTELGRTIRTPTPPRREPTPEPQTVLRQPTPVRQDAPDGATVVMSALPPRTATPGRAVRPAPPVVRLPTPQQASVRTPTPQPRTPQPIAAIDEGETTFVPETVPAVAPKSRTKTLALVAAGLAAIAAVTVFALRSKTEPAIPITPVQEVHAQPIAPKSEVKVTPQVVVERVDTTLPAHIEPTTIAAPLVPATKPTIEPVKEPASIQPTIQPEPPIVPVPHVKKPTADESRTEQVIRKPAKKKPKPLITSPD